MRKGRPSGLAKVESAGAKAVTAQASGLKDYLEHHGAVRHTSRRSRTIHGEHTFGEQMN